MFLKPLGPIPRSSVRWSPLILPAPARDGSLARDGRDRYGQLWLVREGSQRPRHLTVARAHSVR